jgi:hypothetical protein
VCVCVPQVMCCAPGLAAELSLCTTEALMAVGAPCRLVASVFGGNREHFEPSERAVKERRCEGDMDDWWPQTPPTCTKAAQPRNGPVLRRQIRLATSYAACACAPARICCVRLSVCLAQHTAIEAENAADEFEVHLRILDDNAQSLVALNNTRAFKRSTEPTKTRPPPPLLT